MTPLESPIEWKFAAAVRDHLGKSVLVLPPGDFKEFLVRVPDALEEANVVGAPQVSILDDYRTDFLFLTEVFGGFCMLAVECDGHDFHEKTKWQAARDKRRDRRLLRVGIRTMRFAGSEVHRDPTGCAQQVFDYLMGEYTHGVDLYRKVEMGVSP